MSAPVWRRRRRASRLRRALAQADRHADAVVAWARAHLDANPTPWQIDLIHRAFRALAIRDEHARMHAR